MISVLGGVLGSWVSDISSRGHIRELVYSHSVF